MKYIVFMMALVLSLPAYPRGGGGGGGHSSGGHSSSFSSSRSSGSSSSRSSSKSSSGYSSARSNGGSKSGGSWFGRGTSRSAPVSNTPSSTITRGGHTYYVSHTYYGGGHSYMETWYSPTYFWLPWNI